MSKLNASSEAKFNQSFRDKALAGKNLLTEMETLVDFVGVIDPAKIKEDMIKAIEAYKAAHIKADIKKFS